MSDVTRNRQCVILTNAISACDGLATALALLPEDQHPGVHKHLNLALHSALIIAEEIRQQWKVPTNGERNEDHED